MPDQYTSSTTKGYGSRIGSSLSGALVGILFFLGSFGLLFWNEGRVDLSLLAKNAVEIDATTENANAEGSLVAASGIVTSDEQIGDDLFLKPGDYLSIHRNVEMYAWKEEQEDKTKTNLGGSETTETTYTYTKEWTDQPDASSDFGHPEGHENPTPSIDSDDLVAGNIQVGDYELDSDSIELPAGDSVSLTAETADVASSTDATIASKEFIFIASTTSSAMTSPQVGDLRVSYEALPTDQKMVVFGKLQGKSIDPYVSQKGDTLYRAFIGTKDTAIADLHSEFTIMSWILRLVGFLMMWIGLSMFLEPLSTLLDVLPIAGSLSRNVIGGIAFLVSLILSAVTIVVSMVLHSIIAIVIAIAITITITLLIMKSRNKKTTAQPTA